MAEYEILIRFHYNSEAESALEEFLNKLTPRTLWKFDVVDVRKIARRGG